jgi:hypothetical protein
MSTRSLMEGQMQRRARQDLLSRVARLLAIIAQYLGLDPEVDVQSSRSRQPRLPVKQYQSS